MRIVDHLCSYLKLYELNKVITLCTWMCITNMQKASIETVPEKSNLIKVVPVHETSNSFAIFQCKLADPWQPFLLKGLLQVKQWVWAYWVLMVKTQWNMQLWARSNLIVVLIQWRKYLLTCWHNKKLTAWHSGFTFQALPQVHESVLPEGFLYRSLSSWERLLSLHTASWR